jgi:hypothetical protein
MALKCKQCNAEIPPQEHKAHYHGRCRACALKLRKMQPSSINPKPRAGDIPDYTGSIKPQHTLEDVEKQIARVLDAYTMADERRYARRKT